MNNEDFNKLVDEQFNMCSDMLFRKAREYASDEDRLHNFKQAAHLQQTTPIKALSGMMAKHTISIYDMIESGKSFSPFDWDEKISDHINYLLLLKALVEEDIATRVNENSLKRKDSE